MEKKNNASIKWPNDIVLNAKKVCGILSEIKTENNLVKFVVCGIGINVNNTEFAEDIMPTATSLLLESGVRLSRNKMIADVLGEFSELYSEFIINKGFSCLRDEYKRLCIHIGEEVQVLYGSSSLIGKVIDINSNGELILQTEDNETKTIVSGEVSVRGRNGYV